MNIHIQEAASTAFGAQHWSREFPLGDGLGPDIMQAAARTVTEFERDSDVPEELKLAASSLWLGIEQALPGALIVPTDKHDPNSQHRMTPEGWRMHFAKDDADFKRVALNVGLVLSRRTEEAERSPRDVFVWVRPEKRRQGNGLEILRAFEYIFPPTIHPFRNAFEIPAENAAANRLIEQYSPSELSVPQNH